MNIKEYIFLNRIIVFVGIFIFFLVFFLNNSGAITCVHLTYTSEECASCGVTRDFSSFLQLDFSKPINQYSFGLFLYCILQFIYRILIASIGLGLRGKQTKSKNLILNKNVRELVIKKVIIADAMITFLFGIVVFLPFWI